RVEVVKNPNWWDRLLFLIRSTAVGLSFRGAPAGASPESITTNASRMQGDSKIESFGSMDSGLGASRRPGMTNSGTRPITLLIAALGGEGGGVLTGWIVGAAESLGLPVQSTSIPGVAQRTGATTYYLEIVQAPARARDERRPVLALNPGVGDVDVMVA